MSLADELKQRIDQAPARCLLDWVLSNQDAILAALRGRDALDEAFKKPPKEMIEAYLTAQAQYCIDQDNRFAVIVPSDGCAEGLKAALRILKEPA